jgi:hypothetical protein
VDLDAWYTSELEAATRPYLKNRDLYQTEEGYLGIGPHCMKKDDLVVIFDRAKMSFILREHGSWMERWKIVGDAFMLGWIGGSYFGHALASGEPKSAVDEARNRHEKLSTREVVRFVLSERMSYAHEHFTVSCSHELGSLWSEPMRTISFQDCRKKTSARLRHGC